MTDLSFEEQLERRTQEWRELGEKRAEAKSRMEYLREFRKAKIALLASAMPDGSEAQRDRLARAHPEYQQLLDGLAQAVYDFEKLDNDLKAAYRRSELWQSNEANKRAERRQYNA